MIKRHTCRSNWMKPRKRKNIDQKKLENNKLLLIIAYFPSFSLWANKQKEIVGKAVTFSIKQ